MTPAQATLAKAMAEADLQRLVLAMCGHLRLLAWHDNDSRRNRAGLPDLIIVGRRTIWRELKTEKGHLRDEQDVWVSRLARAGQDVAVWRPSDWVTRRIHDELLAIR